MNKGVILVIELFPRVFSALFDILSFIFTGQTSNIEAQQYF